MVGRFRHSDVYVLFRNSELSQAFSDMVIENLEKRFTFNPFSRHSDPEGCIECFWFIERNSHGLI